jgi:hypothetical protein
MVWLALPVLAQQQICNNLCSSGIGGLHFKNHLKECSENQVFESAHADFNFDLTPI